MEGKQVNVVGIPISLAKRGKAMNISCIESDSINAFADKLQLVTYYTPRSKVRLKLSP